MNRKRTLAIALISGFLAALMVYAIYQLQLKQLEMETKMTVAVPAQFIDAGTLIERDMLKLVYVNRSAYRSGMIRNPDELISQSALIPLGKDEPILSWKVSHFHLMPVGGQSTFQIPRSYILSISNGIRAGDHVQLYVSSPEGSSRLFNREVTVASVKTASNIEVDNAEHSEWMMTDRSNEEKLYAYRRDANGAIAHINLNLSSEEWLKLDQQCRENQGKLVIAFESSFWGKTGVNSAIKEE